MTAEELAASPLAGPAQLHDLDEMQHPELVEAEHRIAGRRGYGVRPGLARRTLRRVRAVFHRPPRRTSAG
ncbi:hypothetical protein GCM10010193_69720 [Kitasatospora atroaurantiaca]|uniref:Uncharacterized protein n=1 Tax=Kitasatospora atroaurantiaca TaxID=285545 RepID=A0A561EN64_9ACTN|nr:hypothetical protein [Kitasatospora atroaurantiaca]TWE17056.1 hypothetical protein FB465_2060 [Kitasatospora atroaurantiaca]